MTETLLKVRGLRTWFDTPKGVLRAVDGVSFEIKRGETFALLGESGCGKSMTALSCMQLIPEPAGRIEAGSIYLGDTDILRYSEVQMRNVRGKRIGMIFQEPQTSLNPVLTVGDQIRETVLQHQSMSKVAAKTRVIELLDAVGIPDPDRRFDEYPHQLSGGMKQRIMIAIALAGKPELLIADEPTTALDVTIQAQVLALLKDLQRQTGMAIMLITHDLGVVYEMADHVAVMYAGQVVEQADHRNFFSNPQHPYSQKLFESLPNTMKRGQHLAVIHGSVPLLTQSFTGCRFVDRCDYASSVCHDVKPAWISVSDEQGVRCHRADPEQQDRVRQQPIEQEAVIHETITRPDTDLLRVQQLKVHFPIQKGLFKRTVGHVRAVDGVSMDIPTGKTLALVGESGCGKTTVGKGILQLLDITSGEIVFENEMFHLLRGEALRKRRTDIQIVFQDPYSSMNPRMMVSDIIAEGMLAQNIEPSRRKRQQRIKDLLKQVGLPHDCGTRYPHEFSGGQRQRICIARALAVNPKLIICDEPTSALDVSVQAQILNLLKELQTSLGLSYLFITHNLSVVEYLADEVAVMYLGRIVEQGLVDEVMQNPRHPYTRALLSAVPVIDKTTQRQVIRLEGDLPSPANPPRGCHFHPRCPEAMPQCREIYPDSMQLSDTHAVACHLYASRID